jgi:hypothetical protein
MGLGTKGNKPIMVVMKMNGQASVFRNENAKGAYHCIRLQFAHRKNKHHTYTHTAMTLFVSELKHARRMIADIEVWLKSEGIKK